MHEIVLNGYTAHNSNSRCLHFGTAESYGIEQIHITPGADWENLLIKATFHPPSGDSVVVLLGEDGIIDVPPEATAVATGEYNPGLIVFSGISDGVQRISADIAYTVLGHAPVDGKDSEPTPNQWEQLAAQYQSKVDKQQGAENAGKVLGIGEDGMVVPVEQTGGGGVGNNGATFTPSVSEEGVISWTNDGDLPNPEPVNIKGAPGKPGDNYVLTETDKHEIAGMVKIPDKLPNPHALTFKGAVAGTYDGSAPMEIEIPQGGSGGGSSEWELLTHIKLEEDSAISKIQYDFTYKKMYAILQLPKVENPISTMGSFSFLHGFGLYYSIIGDKQYSYRCELLVERISNCFRETLRYGVENGVGQTSPWQTRNSILTYDKEFGNASIVKFEAGGTLVLPAGTILKVWGQR